ncbi:MAG: Holliday junction branch migration protein RuvA [Saprospiraceae bacterium]
MYYYLKGKLAAVHPTYAVVDCQGVGYHVHISLHTYSQIEKSEEILLYTHLAIKEDAHVLYGFFHPDEKTLFQLLISVSGVGTGTAQLILSALTPDSIRNAILREDDLTFKAIKGIGEKTAKRIILDLKDKVGKEHDTKISPVGTVSSHNSFQSEALSALIALGFQRQKSQQVLAVISQKQSFQSVEELIKLALKQLSS